MTSNGKRVTDSETCALMMTRSRESASLIFALANTIIASRCERCDQWRSERGDRFISRDCLHFDGRRLFTEVHCVSLTNARNYDLFWGKCSLRIAYEECIFQREPSICFITRSFFRQNIRIKYGLWRQSLQFYVDERTSESSLILREATIFTKL